MRSRRSSSSSQKIQTCPQCPRSASGSTRLTKTAEEDETAINDLIIKKRLPQNQADSPGCPSAQEPLLQNTCISAFFWKHVLGFFANKESAKKRNGHFCSVSLAKTPMLVADKDRTHWDHINQSRFHHPKSSLSAYSDTPWFSLYIRRGLKRSRE